MLVVLISMATGTYTDVDWQAFFECIAGGANIERQIDQIILFTIFNLPW